MEKRNPTQHRMTRRAAAHDYTRPGIYHITLHVAEGLGQPFGHVVGNLSAPDGAPDAPRVQLTPLGAMVEQELLHSIPSFYPMIEIQDHVIMPEHMHFIIEVHDPIISSNGHPAHLGQVIAGFKKGCNHRYWEITGQKEAQDQRGKPAGTNAHPLAPAPNSAPAAPSAASCAAGRLLLVTPWTYQYKSTNNSIHVPRCKAMNCVAQALCRTKDTWWKQSS